MWVLIDVSFLTHRARYAMKDMEPEDFPTGLLFNFFEQFKTICNHHQIQSNKVVLFFDSRKSHRKRFFPDYKKKRVEDRTPEEVEQCRAMYVQQDLLRTAMIPNMGIQILRQTGLESDDLMAIAAQQIEADDKALIVTSDQDLLQCVTENVHWFDPNRDNYLSPSGVFEKKGVRPKEFAEVKAIGGCNSDEVPGVPRVGEATAVKYLKGDLPKHHKTYKSIVSPEGQAIIERNRKLVYLPHEKTKPVTLIAPAYNPDKFFEDCKKYGLIPYLKGPRHEEWKQFFDGGYRSLTRKRKKKGRRDVKA